MRTINSILLLSACLAWGCTSTATVHPGTVVASGVDFSAKGQDAGVLAVKLGGFEVTPALHERYIHLLTEYQSAPSAFPSPVNPAEGWRTGQTSDWCSAEVMARYLDMMGWYRDGARPVAKRQ